VDFSEEKHTWENSQPIDLNKFKESILKDVDQRISISDRRAAKLEMKESFNSVDMEFDNTNDEDSDEFTDPLYDRSQTVDLMEQCLSGSYSVNEKKKRRKLDHSPTGMAITRQPSSGSFGQGMFMIAMIIGLICCSCVLTNYGQSQVLVQSYGRKLLNLVTYDKFANSDLHTSDVSDKLIPDHHLTYN